MSTAPTAVRVSDHRTLSAMRIPELAGWCLCLLMLSLAVLHHQGRVLLFNDSYQYLSMAENLRNGHGLSTSIIHFDAERSTNRLPAPATTFPGGYSVLIWIISLAGFSLRQAGFLAAIASSVAVLLVMYGLAHTLNLGTTFTRLCFLAWITNSYVLLFSITIASEPVFAAFLCAGLALAAAHEVSSDRPFWPLFAGCSLVALSFWVRYAALFVFVGMGIYAALRYVRTRDTKALWHWAVSLAMGATVILSGMLRNLLIMGKWEGSHPKNVHRSAALIVHRFIAAHYELVAGHRSMRDPFGIAVSLVAVGLLIACVWLIYSGKGWSSLRPGARRAVELVILSSAVYYAAIVYVWFTTTVNMHMRMFLPVVPVLLIGFAVLVQSAWSNLTPSRNAAVMAAGAALFLFLYAVSNVASAWAAFPSTEDELVAKDLSVAMGNGQSVRSWLEAHVPEGAPIVATDGQATEYVLGRPTVSLPEVEMTQHIWDENSIRQEMDRFGANYIIVYPKADFERVPPQTESPFLSELTQGNPPTWLTQVAQSPAVRVFQRHSDSR